MLRRGVVVGVNNVRLIDFLEKLEMICLHQIYIKISILHSLNIEVGCYFF